MPIPCACMVHTVRLAMKVLTDMGLAPSMKEACLFLSRPSLNHHISLVQIESQSGAMVCYKIEPYVCGATQTTYAVHEASNCLDTDWLYWESATPTSTSTSTPISQELPGYPRPMLTPQQTKSFSNTFLASYPLEVARQLTLIEHEFFQSLTLPDDLSNLSTTDNRAKALSEWTSWSNKVSSSSDSSSSSTSLHDAVPRWHCPGS
jgi:hypothetical protein